MTPIEPIISFTQREQLLISLALHYFQEYAKSGMPGHNHLILIAKLALLLDFKLPSVPVDLDIPSNLELFME
jgi:hypothetical protein